jgi:hypothetical protein
MAGRTNTEQVGDASASVMWWHLIPRLATVLTGRDRRSVSTTYRGVFWAAHKMRLRKVKGRSTDLG